VLISKVIFVLSFVFIFSSCEDTPQEVGIYKAPTNTVNQKHDVIDGSKLRLSMRSKIEHHGLARGNLLLIQVNLVTRT